MPQSTGVTIVCLLLLSVTSACSKAVQNSARESATGPTASPSAQRITSESVVKVDAQPVEIPPGGSAEAVVRVTIQNGYHVNANPPTYSYLKATALEIPPAAGVSVGAISYPPPRNAKLSFAAEPIAVYEGEIKIRATLKADESAKSGERSLFAKLRIQACDDQLCYPPGTLDLAIPVRIK